MVTTDAAQLHAVKGALEDAGFEPLEADLSWVPSTTVRVEGSDAEQLVKLLEALEDLDDVQQVDTNADFDVEALSQT